MRIAFLAYRDIKNPSAVGGDFYLWELAKGLCRMGYQVIFVCNRFQGSKQAELIDGVKVIRIKGLLTLPLKILGYYIKNLKGRCDIIVEEAIGGFRPPFFAGVYVKEPLIAVWHQKHDKIFHEQYPSLIAFLLSLLEVFLARFYQNDIIITPSKGSKRKLLELGFKHENVKVVYDGVGEIFFNARSDKKRENIIVCLGKLRRYKRFDHAIKAFKYFIEHEKVNCKLIIVGKLSEMDRYYTEELRKLVDKLGIKDYVEFKFNISEKEKLELLEKSLVLLQPSPVEGFSIVVAEANICGTPVVVSSGVPDDVVIDGYNGFRYKFGDLEALARAIGKLLKDSGIWNKMSKNAHEWAKQFTWHRSVITFSKVLEQIRPINDGQRDG
ncbi:MAG: glycosyltransferase family 4 protein [Nitrososphaeria archaeon]